MGGRGARLEPAGGRPHGRHTCRHLALRWPTRPQMSQVLSRLGQSATTCAVEPHAWHCAGSGHAPARWPITPQLLHAFDLARPLVALARVGLSSLICGGGWAAGVEARSPTGEGVGAHDFLQREVQV